MSSPRPRVRMALAGLGACACTSGIEKPAPPDLSRLQAAYTTPTGTFHVEDAPEVEGTAVGRATAARALGIARRIRRMLRGAFDALDAVEQKASSSTAFGVGERVALMLDGEGTLQIHQVCEGWDASGRIDQAANGAMDLTVNVTERGVDPVVWGSFSDCRYRELGQEVQVGAGSRRGVGDVRVHLGENYTIDDFGADAPMLVDIDGRVSIGAIGTAVDFDFVVKPADKAVEVRVAVVDGSVVAVVDQQNVLARIRAANGEFVCDAERVLCRAAGGDAGRH